MSILTVALTGGIASGKSFVARLLARHGCFVQSADRLAHDLMKPAGPAWGRIVSRFGKKVLSPDRTINRRRLGAIIFSSDQDRHFLNNLIHPLVLAEKKATIRKLEKMGTHKIFVSEAALTIEAGFAPFFDKIIVVQCPEKVQVERLVTRDGITIREARRRVRSQMPADEKATRADYLIDTSGSKEETTAQTERVYKCLLGDYRKKRARGRRISAKGRTRDRRRATEP